MALKREYLKSMGLTDEQVSAIIDAHTDTVEALKKQRDQYKADADKLPAVQKELDDIKAGKDWKSEYDTLKKSFDDYKADVAGKETLATKQAAFRKLLTAENIPDKYHDRILRMTDFSAVELENGAIKDEAKQREGIKTDWGDFVATTETRGANVDTPPDKTKTTITRADIYKKDDHGRYVMSTAERQKALAEHPDLMKG